MNTLRHITTKIALLAMAVVLCTAAPVQAAASVGGSLTSSQHEMAKILNGTWQGNFYRDLDERHYTYDKATIQYLYSGTGTPRVYLTLESFPGGYITLHNYSMDGDTMSFTFEHGLVDTAVTLSLKNNSLLEGTLEKNGSKFGVELKKISQKPVDLGQRPQFEFEELSGEKWLEKLKEYPTYQSGGTPIPFTYELGNRKNLQKTIDTFKLDALMAAQPDDVSKMTALLNFVCDNFRHNGDSGMPEQQDAASLMEYSKQNGGIECRGLSIILAELCRAYRIPAKSIKCAPYTVDSAFCHVVVHAYSKELNQWVMLDPTYRLILTDADGNYVDLPTLRASLVSGAKLVANPNAGRGKQLFYMDYYRAYMTKNTFHFSSALRFETGSEGVTQKTIYTLAPANYPNSYANYRGERVAATGDAFWAKPN